MEKLLKISVVILLFIFACSSDGDENKNGVTSISIQADDYFVLDYGNTLDIKVVDNNGADISDLATIYFNGQVIDGTSVEVTTKGSYVISANYKGLDAPEFNVNADVVSAIILEKDRPNTIPGGFIRLTAKDNFGNEIPGNVNYEINGNSYSEGVFSFDVVDDYTVTATFNSMFNGEISGEISFGVKNYTKRVLVEDYTGAWCGYCPRVAYKLEKAEELNPKVIGLGIHNGDAMFFSEESAMRAAFNVNGFPTAKINRMSNWSESSLPWDGPFSSLDNLTGDKAEVGIAFASTLSGSSLNLDLDIEFATTTTGKKLVVYLVEDGLVYPQANYFNANSSTPWFAMGNPITKFVHNNVLRTSLTDVFGDEIIIDEGKDVYNYQKTINLDSRYDSEQIEIIAFVVDGSGKVVNVQHANLGESVGLD